jgi:signal transduction histidine kinase
MGFVSDRDGRVWTSDTRSPGRLYTMPDLTGVSDAAIPGPAYGGQVSPRIRGPFFLDRDGTLWNMHSQHGLLRQRSILAGRAGPGQLDAFSTSDGLSSDAVTEFFEDREGSIWVATNAGLDRFRPANVVLERRIPVTASIYGYDGRRVGDTLFLYTSTSEDPTSSEGGLYGALYQVRADGAPQLVIPRTLEPFAMVPAADGGLWIGTDRGLYKLKVGALSTEPLPPGAQEELRGVAETAAGELWVSIVRHGVWHRVKGVWSRVIEGRPDEINTWTDMSFDAQGALWMTFDQTVGRYANGRLTEFSAAAGPNIGHIETTQADARGVWFGGQFGLARYDGRAFQTLSSERLPALAFVTGIIETGGQTWISSHAGVLRFDTAALERAMARPSSRLPGFEFFDHRDGVSGALQDGPYTNSDSSAFMGPDGHIWLLTDRGVDWLDPHDIYLNTLPPPVAIRALTVNGHTYPSPQDLRLAAGASNLEIDYAALSFIEPSRVAFRYRLDGVDKEWVDPGERRQVFYTRLGPGTYHFHVIAANDAGVWNRTGAVVAFTIAPTFLQSIWFKMLVALALAALAWLAFSLRLRQETARLQGSFNVRIAERERIARELHDTLLQGFQALLLRFQTIANRAPADDALRDSMEDALNRADAVLAEGRARVRELRSGAASDDLAQSLAEAASNIIVGDTPRFDLTVEGAQRPLSALVAEEAPRIFEEAVRNVVEHADARRIEATLTFGRRGLSLSVRDGGVGMAKSILVAGERDGHFGLIGMRERARRIGGRLDVTSREGGGTEVVLFVPARAAYKARARSPAPSFASQPGGAT